MTIPAAPSNEPHGELRIGDPERNDAISALSTHLTQGRLDSTEYDERVARVMQAKTATQISANFLDLPEPRPSLPGDAVVRRSAAAVAVPQSTAPATSQTTVDRRSTPQRIAAVAIGASGILSVVLFFTLGTWLVFLLPALISVIAGAWWGSDWRRP